MAIAIAASVDGNDSGFHDEWNVSVPANDVGDLLILAVTYGADDVIGASTIEAGWTLVAEEVCASSEPEDFAMSIWAKVAESGDDAATDITVSHGSFIQTSWVGLTITGVDTSSLAFDEAILYEQWSTSQVITALTSSNNDEVLRIGGSRSSNSDPAPTGTTLVDETASPGAGDLFVWTDDDQSVGEIAVTLGTGSRWISATIALPEGSSTPVIEAGYLASASTIYEPSLQQVVLGHAVIYEPSLALAAASTGDTVEIYDGSSWVAATVQVYDGSSWVAATIEAES